MNNVYLKGRAGMDAEIAYLPSGTPVAKFSLAVAKKVKEDWQTTWVRIAAFGKTAELCKEVVRKGSTVMLAGELSIREYQGKDGTRKTATEVIAHTVTTSLFSGKLPEQTEQGFEPGGSPSEEF